MMTKVEYNVAGLKELIRDARKVDRDLPKSMRARLLPISQDIKSKATQRAEGLGGVHRHAARRGLRAGATQNSAWIALLAKEPTIFGAEFGGGARPTTHQFPPWRGSGGGAGYFVYPTIRGTDVPGQVEEIIDDFLHDW